jgi:hypothetical protein
VNADGPQIGDETINKTLAYLDAHKEQWLGWTWWAAGPWDTEYMFSIEPTNLGLPTQSDSPVMQVLRPYFANARPGDANFDGLVNAADYTIWRNTLGRTGAGLAADFNIDGVVNSADHRIWKTNFQIETGAASAAPEPPALMLFVAASLICCAARASRRQRSRTLLRAG